jgi:aminopeptidase N
VIFPVLLALAVGSPLRDTYPRQSLDAEHYRFALTLTDSVDRIEGEARVRLRMTAAGVTSIFLDLANASPARAGKGMSVTGVTLGSTTLSFRHTDDRLTMTLPAPSTAGQVLEVTVRYHGIPADGLQIKPTRHGDRAFFSDDWPNKAREWLPTIDHVGDKASMEMAVTAPAHYQVISNGRRVEESDLPGTMRRTVWLESVPISPWLYVLGVARFAVQTYGDYRGVPLETWVFAKDRDAGFHDFSVPVKDAMAFYSEFVGPYAYEKLANVQSTATGGGMEAASAIMYDQRSVDGTRSLRWRNVIIHEIAHQWFGNAVTEADWNDVWLSEGFATYFTSLFIEHAYGRDEFVQVLRDSRKTIVDFYEKRPEYRVVHENLSDMSQVTTGMTYQKGAWVLHMLRQRIGDDRFWAGIREYYARHMNGTATTTDFRQVMERASGQDLAAFFEQWLYRGQIPRIEGTWAWDAAAREVVVEMRQSQPGPAFALDLEVGVEGAGARPTVQRASVRSEPARLRIAAPERPRSVMLDPMTRALFVGELRAVP